MTIRTQLKYIFPTFLFVFIISCDLFGPDDEQPVDPLGFSWTVDTLHYPGSLQLLYSNIWGASLKDIYAVGHNSNGPKMFHYDGNIWDYVPLAVPLGGTTLPDPFGLEDIYGFARDDIWAVGHHRERIETDSTTIRFKTSLAIHYNGYEWVESDTIYDERLFSIGGGSSADFWVGGLNGILYHYNGTDFTYYPLPVDINPESPHIISDIVGDNRGTAYALLDIPGGGTITPMVYILKFEAGAWSAIDSAPGNTWIRLWLSPQGTLYAVGVFHLDRWENGIRTTMLDSTICVNIYGTSDDDFYVSGRNSRWDNDVAVWHYNGTEFRRLPIPDIKDAYTAGIWTDGTEVFILAGLYASSPNTSAVIHGK